MYQVEWGEGEKQTVDNDELEAFLRDLAENGYREFVVRDLIALGAQA